jgi:aspartate aminotransferase
MDATRFPAPVRPFTDTLIGSRIRALANTGLGRRDIIALWFGESDRTTPAFINEAAKRALDQGHTFYTLNRGIHELRAAIATYITRLRGRSMGEDRITVTASGVSAIMLVMQALVDPGDNVVMVTPLWPNCGEAVRMMGGEPRRVALQPGLAGWHLDLERLFAACDSRTRAIFVNSPGNPTGWMMSAEDLAALLDFCRKRRIWAVGDDVYERIVFDRPRAPSLLDFATADDPVISVNSFSKSWCMTGWRLGWVVTPPALGEQLGKFNEFNISGATSFVQHAGVAAIEQGEGYIAEMVADYSRSRELVVQRLNGFKRVHLTRPQGGFYAFFTVDGLSDSFTAAEQIFRQTSVGLAPGIAFGPEGEGFLRLCFATNQARVSEALDRLAEVLN